MQSDLQDVLIRNLDGIGHKQSELVTTWSHERTKNARVVANNPLMAKCAKITRDDKEYVDIVQYLEVVKSEYDYKDVLVSNNKGLVTIATMGESVGNDISEMDYFKQAVQGNTFVSSVIPSEIPLANEFGEKELGMPTMFVFHAVERQGWGCNWRCCLEDRCYDVE